MRPIRRIVLFAFVTVSVMMLVIHSACNKNKCAGVVCANGGTCNNGSCTCLPGFEGPSCATYSRNKFLYTFSGGDSCGTYPYNQHQIQFVAVLYDTTEMLMLNVLDSMQDSAICTIIKPDSFAFQGSNNSTTYTGWGKLSNDSLWLQYHVIHDTTAFDCKYFGLKRTTP
jgi:hypothetical protein